MAIFEVKNRSQSPFLLHKSTINNQQSSIAIQSRANRFD